MDTGLREHRRDLSLLDRAGDGQLAPPEPDELLSLARSTLWLPSAPRGGASPADRPVSATRTYLRWKPGVSTTAAFTLQCEDGSQVLLMAKRYGDGKAAILAERDEPPQESGSERAWRPVAVLPDRGLVLRVFPSDRELPGHRVVLDARRLSRVAEEAGLVPERSVRRRRTATTLLRYKPERRSVWRLEFRLRDVDRERFPLAARVLPPPVAERIAGARAIGGAVDSAAVGPRLRATVPHAGVLLEEWLEVETFGDDGLGHAAEAGGLLARLHRSGAGLPVRSSGPVPRAPLAGLFRSTPELWEEAEDVPAPDLVQDAVIHGDLHPDQLARSLVDGRWVLLDLDAAGPGDRSRELAGWIVDDLLGSSERSFEDAGGALLEGYARAQGDRPSDARLRSHAADLLVHAAAASLRRLEEGAEQRAAHCLALAQAIAGGSR